MFCYLERTFRYFPRVFIVFLFINCRFYRTLAPKSRTPTPKPRTLIFRPLKISYPSPKTSYPSPKTLYPNPRRPFWSISKPRPQNGPRKPPESHFGAFPSPGRRMGPGSLQKAILEHFQAQVPEWAQEASRKPFWSISKPRPQNEPRKPPEAHFTAFPSPGRRMDPGSNASTI